MTCCQIRPAIVSQLAGLLLLPLALYGAPAAAAGAHQHGAAQLDVVLDGAQLVVALESPLDNLLGFEHAPRNESQRAAVRKMEASLRAANVLRPDAAAACTLTGVKIEHPFAGGQAPATAAAPGGAAAEHTDVDVSWTFNCAQPAALRRIEVGLFELFPGLHSLATQFAGPRGQTAIRLTRQQRVLAW